MKIRFSDVENDLINVCNTRHDSGLSCRRCKYKEKCARFFDEVNQNYFKLKEIKTIWKNQQFTEQ